MARIPISFNLILLLILFQALRSSSNDCYRSLVEENEASYPCGSPGEAYIGSPRDPYKKLAVSMSIKYTDYCHAMNELVLFTVKITPTTGVNKNIMKATYRRDTNTIKFTSEDPIGEKDIFITPQASSL